MAKTHTEVLLASLYYVVIILVFLLLFCFLLTVGLCGYTFFTEWIKLWKFNKKKYLPPKKKREPNWKQCFFDTYCSIYSTESHYSRSWYSYWYAWLGLPDFLFLRRFAGVTAGFLVRRRRSSNNSKKRTVRQVNTPNKTHCVHWFPWLSSFSLLLV